MLSCACITCVTVYNVQTKKLNIKKTIKLHKEWEWDTCSSGIGMNTAAYPLLSSTLFDHKGHVYVLILNFECGEQGKKQWICL